MSDEPVPGASAPRADATGEGAPDEVVISDPRMLRALAHPARITVLHHLFAGEVLTATEFAQISGLSASAMSYHLRALERWGLIGRAEPAGDGRERPWQSIGRSIRIDAEASGAAHAAKDQVLGSLVELLRADLSTALARPAGASRAATSPPGGSALPDTEPGGIGPVPLVAAPAGTPANSPGAGTATAPMGFTVVPLTLTDDGARRLMTEISELLEQRPQQTPPAGARRYHVYWAVLPLDASISDDN